jgi:hypothetical protein
MDTVETLAQMSDDHLVAYFNKVQGQLTKTKDRAARRALIAELNAIESEQERRIDAEVETKITATERSGSSHATAPAIKSCAWCARSLDMRKRASFALFGGDIICARRHDDEIRDRLAK